MFVASAIGALAFLIATRPPRPPRKAPAAAPPAASSAFRWTSRGGRAIRIVGPSRLGLPSFGDTVRWQKLEEGSDEPAQDNAADTMPATPPFKVPVDSPSSTAEPVVAPRQSGWDNFGVAVGSPLRTPQGSPRPVQSL